MIDDFLKMGAYGFYVWSAWGLCLFVLGIMVLSTFTTRKTLRSRILAQSRRQARLAQVEVS